MSKNFSHKDQLQLQQLLTREFLTTQLDEKPNSESGELSQNMHASLPDKWRLIPEDTVLHKWQYDCLEKWPTPQGKGTVKIATGAGKTIFALAAAQKLQNFEEPDLRLAIVVPTISLMHQWQDELKNSNIPERFIGLMGGNAERRRTEDLRVLICVINSACKYLDEYVRQFINWSSNLLLIVDECHRADTDEFIKIFRATPSYTLGLSATPEKEQDNKGEGYATSEIGKALGPIIYELSLKSALEAGLLTPFEVWHIALPLNDKESAKYFKLSKEITELRKSLKRVYQSSRSKQGFIPWCQTQSSRNNSKEATRFISLTSERKRLIYRAKSRTELTLRILSLAMKNKNRRAIVFHETIDAINQIFRDAVKGKMPVVLEHSKLPSTLRESNIEIFRKGIARIIISAKSLIEGFNVPSADIGIIAASSGSVRQRIQSLGRMLRKKEIDETAIIFVLYIQDTVDEEIYGKADWEFVIGARRNRYFKWIEANKGKAKETQSDLYDITQELQEMEHPPRQYRPPCSEIDTKDLRYGSIYPAQTTGTSVKVDYAKNLRLESGDMVKVDEKVIDKILEINKSGYATVTPCNHLIVRKNDKKSKEAEWVYLCNVDLPEENQASSTIKLLLKQRNGRPVIIKLSGRNEIYAIENETSRSLLIWIESIKNERGIDIRELYWNGDSHYWIELGSKRISFSENIGRLEFPL